MGMLACYMEADRELIERLKTESGEEIFEEIEEIDEEGEAEVYDLDKLWDGLRFILTGVSANSPRENSLLSEAIQGTEMFTDDDDDEFIAYIYPERAAEISAALDEFDIEKALAGFKPHVLAENDIYPDIWEDDETDELREELSESFCGLKEFYQSIADEGKGVIVSIY